MSTKGAPRGLVHLYTLRTEPIDFPVEDPATGEVTTVSVVIVKPNSHDQEQVETRAAAARARFNAVIKDTDSDAYMALVDQADQGDREEMIGTIVNREIRDRALAIYYEIASSETWSDEDYLMGLQVSWHDGQYLWKTMNMQTIASSPPEDEDLDDDDRAEYALIYEQAIHTRDEIARFQQEVGDRTMEERDAAAASRASWSDEQLREDFLKSLIAISLEKRYQDAYETQLLYYATRQAADLSARYFGSSAEVDRIDDDTRVTLLEGYGEIAVGGLEGKGSPGSPGSSTSSEPTDAAEASPQSGLVDATP